MLFKCPKLVGFDRSGELIKAFQPAKLTLIMSVPRLTPPSCKTPAAHTSGSTAMPSCNPSLQCLSQISVHRIRPTDQAFFGNQLSRSLCLQETEFCKIWLFGRYRCYRLSHEGEAGSCGKLTNHTGTRLLTASAMAGNISRLAGVWSNCRPPWLLMMTPSQPASTAFSASVGERMPCRHQGVLDQGLQVVLTQFCMHKTNHQEP